MVLFFQLNPLELAKAAASSGNQPPRQVSGSALLPSQGDVFIVVVGDGCAGAASALGRCCRRVPEMLESCCLPGSSIVRSLSPHRGGPVALLSEPLRGDESVPFGDLGRRLPLPIGWARNLSGVPWFLGRPELSSSPPSLYQLPSVRSYRFSCYHGLGTEGLSETFLPLLPENAFASQLPASSLSPAFLSLRLSPERSDD